MANPDLAAIQRRTLRLLFATQVISGVGVAIGASVGALLAAELAGTSVSGLAQSFVVVGAALLALPATAIVQRSGRRLSLAAAYLVAAVGSIVVVVAAARGSIALLFAGFFLFGAGTAANMQARYAAVDLAPAALRGRHLSLVVWATTLGAVTGPNLAAFAGASIRGYGVPTLAGPFAFSAVVFLVAALMLTLLMRPDPAVVARQALAQDPKASRSPRAGLRAAFGVVASHASARLGMIAMAVGHVVMVG
ncbi:MAG: MFS transporter, partial [Cytophagaceae bacterium]|nr:MFS transporter [Gemmatimonadaceae bacterium]